jgi:hypothetical protein
MKERQVLISMVDLLPRARTPFAIRQPSEVPNHR